MKTTTLRKQLLNFSFCSITFLLHTAVAKADGFLSLSAGMFSIKAKTSTTEGSKSSLGAYSLGYDYQLRNYLNLYIGYKVILANTVSGDMSYGPEIGVHYYPISDSAPLIIDFDTKKMKVFETWRPFTGLTFNQRQYQSVQANYAGFGFRFGADRHWNENLNLRIQADLSSLTGPSNATGSEMVIGAGILIGY